MRRGLQRLLSFFFQAEDGIRDHCVTGVQTCALPISRYHEASCWSCWGVSRARRSAQNARNLWSSRTLQSRFLSVLGLVNIFWVRISDRKSTRLNSSHTVISYAVFCLKKKKSTHKLIS